MRGGPPWGHQLAGTLEEVLLDSPALAGNHLGDPARRPLLVQLPPGGATRPGGCPTVYVLQGYAGMLADWDRRPAFQPTVPELVDRAMLGGSVPPCIVVWVDAWTRLGGSQFLDSPGTGCYQRYLCEDVVGFVDARYPTLAAREHRAVIGLSSGGFGALHAALARPDVFGAFASHAGDAAFELSLLPDLAAAYRILRDRYDRSFPAWQAASSAPGFAPQQDEFSLLMVHALAACFSARPDGEPELPFETSTGRLLGDVWGRWLALDPLRVVGERPEALASLRGVYVDAGRADDYRLDVAAEQLVAAMAAAGREDVAFELFEGGHGHLSRRYPRSLAYLVPRLG